MDDQTKGLTKLDPFLAHHPACSHLETHTLRIGSFRICLGCLVTYSGFLVTVAITSSAIIPFSSFGLWFLSFVSLFFSLGLKKLNSFRMLVRFILGISLALFFSIVFSIQSPVIKTIAFILLGISVFAYPFLRHSHQCNECLVLKY